MSNCGNICCNSVAGIPAMLRHTSSSLSVAATAVSINCGCLIYSFVSFLFVCPFLEKLTRSATSLSLPTALDRFGLASALHVLVASFARRQTVDRQSRMFPDLILFIHFSSHLKEGRECIHHFLQCFDSRASVAPASAPNPAQSPSERFAS